MKLSSYTKDGTEHYGVVTDDGGIIDLTSRIGDTYPDLKSLIAGDGFAAATAAIVSGTDTPSTASTSPPLAAPEAPHAILPIALSG